MQSLPLGETTLLIAAAFAVYVLVTLILFSRHGAERRALSADLSSAQSDLARLTQERDQIRHSLAEATSREADLRHRLDQVQHEHSEQKSEIARLGAALEHAEQSAERALDAARLQAERDMAALRDRTHQQITDTRRHAEEQLATVKEMRTEMARHFQHLSTEALKAQGEEVTRRNRETLTATLAPLKENVAQFQKALTDMHGDGRKDIAALRNELEGLSKRSAKISEEANALTRALRSDQQKQGAWGEMVLETLLERSGLRKGEEYETQAHRETDEGRRVRPDVVVYLPGDKTMVIDSKVSLTAYTDLVNAETEVEAASARKRHLDSLRAHVRGLGSKGYHTLEAATVDYVILFVPIEGALSEALRDDGALTEFAVEHNVMIATPTTLMMALKTVANVWAVERRNRNAEAIADRAGKLYDKVAGFVGNMESLGKRLEHAQRDYNTAFDQLSRGRGNVLSQVETLRELGAKTTKSLGTDYEPDAELEALRSAPQLTEGTHD